MPAAENEPAIVATILAAVLAVPAVETYVGVLLMVTPFAINVIVPEGAGVTPTALAVAVPVIVTLTAVFTFSGVAETVVVVAVVAAAFTVTEVAVEGPEADRTESPLKVAVMLSGPAAENVVVSVPTTFAAVLAVPAVRV